MVPSYVLAPLRTCLDTSSPSASQFLLSLLPVCLLYGESTSLMRPLLGSDLPSSYRKVHKFHSCITFGRAVLLCEYLCKFLSYCPVVGALVIGIRNPHEEQPVQVTTLGGQKIWRRRHYRVRRAKVPGTFYFSVLDNGVISNEFWRFDSPPPLEKAYLPAATEYWLSLASFAPMWVPAHASSAFS